VQACRPRPFEIQNPLSAPVAHINAGAPDGACADEHRLNDDFHAVTLPLLPQPQRFSETKRPES